MELQDIDLKDLIERETGEKFNKKGYIKCPFHNEKTPSLSVKFFPDKNKEKFKCFGCGEVGDSIDFIIKLKGMEYLEARKYLKLSVEKSIHEELIEKVKDYIKWELSKFRVNQQCLGLFNFVNDKGEIAYFKAKFMNVDEKKEFSYYHIANNKVISKRGTEEIPYNLYRIIEAIENEDIVIICEGEKDANKLNSMFKSNGYAATSIKGCKDLSVLEGARIYVCSDTGEAGEQYKWRIYKELYENSKEFKFINLPGIKNIGDNKDVTDWLEIGHDKKDLLNAFERSLDLKSRYELQQNKSGIYKIAYKGKGENVVRYKKYLTDFRLIAASRIRFVDEEREGVKLISKSSTGEKIEKIGESIVFDDTKSFRNFLGTLDLSFKGTIEELIELKVWINKYFALESEEIHQGIKFVKKNGKLLLITNDGTIGKGEILKNVKADKRNNVDVIEVENTTKEELKEIKKHIFKFSSPDKTIPIVGTIINNLAVYQNQELKKKLHHLLIVGESGSGKSTILENVIAPILNYPKRDIRSIGLITPFALIKGLSDGNYSMLFDEFKPSSLDRYKIAKLSETLRNLYDRATISRGDKSFRTKDFQLNRPLILVGEESYPNQEKALIERSCIVYLAKKERIENHTEAMKWIIKNEELLNKLGRSLIETILGLSVEEYEKIRSSVEESIKGLNNRPLNTAINICCGIEIFNMLLKHNRISTITKYEEHVINNIKSEILEGGVETNSTIENMLILYNDMIEDGRALNSNNVVKCRGDGIFIKTSEMINQIHEHVNRFGSDIIPLGLKDFKKQASKSGYLEGSSNKVIKIGDKTVRFDTYSKKLLRKLKVNSIVPPEFEKVTEEDGK